MTRQHIHRCSSMFDDVKIKCIINLWGLVSLTHNRYTEIIHFFDIHFWHFIRGATTGTSTIYPPSRKKKEGKAFASPSKNA